jgi:hypothetical protein
MARQLKSFKPAEMAAVEHQQYVGNKSSSVISLAFRPNETPSNCESQFFHAWTLEAVSVAARYEGLLRCGRIPDKESFNVELMIEIKRRCKTKKTLLVWIKLRMRN